MILKLQKTKTGFTLAETLLTLGIIGIIVALTLPTIINKIQHKQLEAGFKKAYSTFSQSTINLKREDGEGLSKHYATYDKNNGGYIYGSEFRKKLLEYSNLKIIGNCNYQNIQIKNYTKTKAEKAYLSHVPNFTLLSNGMCFRMEPTAGMLMFKIDTNGLKSPNALGHDVFYFYIDENDTFKPLKMSKLYTEEELKDENLPSWSYVIGNPCSSKSTQEGNGAGCGYYALINQNPDDQTKGYWESLP